MSLRPSAGRVGAILTLSAGGLSLESFGQGKTMRTVVRGGVALGLVALGYVLGSGGLFWTAAAQDQSPTGQTDELTLKIRAAHEALAAAQQMLEGQGAYVPAIKGLNSMAVTAGGLNAVEDLETGRGVDPETFAGLYAGRATDAVKAELSFDEQGRLLYKSKLVRLYPISRLRHLFDERDRLSGIDPKKANVPQQ